MTSAALKSVRPVEGWLESMPAPALEALAARFATGLERDGLSVYDPVSERARPITPTLTPVPLDPSARDSLDELAPRLLSAAVKIARRTLERGETALACALYGGFTALELSTLRRDPGRLAQVAAARLDLSFGSEGKPRVIEINATIPAMQGYSDLVAHGWIRAMARERGLPTAAAERLVAGCGSNTEDLLGSLLGHYERAGGRLEQPSILIVSRRDDAQGGELAYYARVFAAAGHRTRHVTQEDVQVDRHGRAHVRGEPFDLVYRHIFARRIAPGSAMAHLLQNPGRTVVLNPILSPLEVKGLLALLHDAGSDPHVAATLELDEAELHAITALVPWTRLLRAAPARLLDGTRVDDLVRWIGEHPDGVVLKRSWDYGGRSVVIGATRDSDETRARMASLFGPDCVAWRQLVGRAARDEHAWVVQEYLPSPARRHLAIERDPSGRPHPVWRDLFTDLSLFANLGVARRPGGGASRVSSGRVVNICNGGGLAPLVPIPTIEALFASPPWTGTAQEPDVRSRAGVTPTSSNREAEEVTSRTR